MGGSHNGDSVVVEDRGDIFRRELIRGVTDEETCLADSTVANNDAPMGRVVSVCLSAWRTRHGRLGRCRTYLIVATTMAEAEGIR